ncbi:S49 family peptidase [Bordetella bronchiseptica]|uniref:S49 family peptidase n=1 Tax=Bordetella bronchiseptica TaxID=518 RepID=UPI000460F2EC|nr:S49 family peptidase [Bordetella bronchiseptica]KDD09864.1 putative signal peptide peptidase SppA, 36K type [Bordetella bronchiseptica MBORD707]VEI25164.1 Probable protease sohB [Bordetella bronchiseptica]
MKNYHRLANLIFNQPLAVTDQMLEMAVAWANRAMNLNIINLPSVQGVIEPAADWSEPAPAAASPAEQRRIAAAESGVYVIPVHGVLVSRSAHLNVCETMTSYEQIRAMFNVALADPAVQHIVFDVDSPGGSALGCGELADEIAAARGMKPMTAISNFSAYSAAYWLASAADTLIVSRSSGVGSIGVIARHADLSAKMAAEGVKITSVYAGARKNDLNPAEPISGDGLAFLQEMVGDMYAQFADGVARNRGLSVEKIKATEAGVYFGARAVAQGLADSIEPPQAAINRIAADLVANRQAGRRSVAARAAAMNVQNRL